jgi:NADH-quinone oxidoreductase subunit L
MTPTLALLTLLLPLAGGALLGVGALSLPRVASVIIGPGVVWLAFICVLAMFFGGQTGDYTYWTWIKAGGFELPANLRIDHLSLFMGLVITGVGGLIVTYSVGYMAHEADASYARFFCYMDVFIFSMLLLVLAGNFVFLLIGWALVGLSSYLLIGFYYWRPSAVLAARKAFVMNVIGDIGILLAIFVIFFQFHTVTYAGVFAAISRNSCAPPLQCLFRLPADQSVLELIAFLLLVGAIAKSAQLPLHTWLPDAMEGPTPVSALIHAATMVTAGVYLVGRMHPIYDAAPIAHGAVAIIGAVTALFAATIAIVQTDIKRVLAYSTMSQIGYMFLAVGIGAYGAGFFHLLSHAFFKALLFMAAGNVIHALADEQDMRRFGGLWRQMRPTAIAFLVGSLSLVGIIPFVGFFSKEGLLGDAFSKPDTLSQAVWAVGFVTAILTGFYTGRMWWIAFWGEPARERPVEQPHEAPNVMLVPVLLLAVLSTVGGLLQVSAVFHGGWKLVTDYLAPAVGRPSWEPGSIEYLVTAVTVILAGLAFLAAYNLYVRPVWARWRDRFPGARSLLEHKYYLDEAYDYAFVRPMDWTAREGLAWVDRTLIDGAVRGVSTLTRDTAAGLSLTQTGYFRNYVLVFLGGAVVAGGLVLYRALNG